MTQQIQIGRFSKVLCKYCHVNLQGHEQASVASHVLSGRKEKTDLLCCAKKLYAVCFAKMLLGYNHNLVDLFRKYKVKRSRRINTSGLLFLFDTSHVQKT